VQQTEHWPIDKVFVVTKTIFVVAMLEIWLNPVVEVRSCLLCRGSAGWFIPQPDQHEITLAVDFRHHSDLLAPLFRIRLVDADLIDP
jgi:hypothetical protein